MAFGGELATVSVLRAVRVVEGGDGDVSGFGCAWGLPGGGSALSGKIGDRTTWVRGVPLDEIGERTTRGRTSGAGVDLRSSARRPSSMASVTHSFDGTRSLPPPPVEFKTVFFRSVTAVLAAVISRCAWRESGNAI